MKRGLLGGQSLPVVESTRGGPAMLYVGLDLSRKRLDFHACRGDGELVAAGAAPPDGDGPDTARQATGRCEWRRRRDRVDERRPLRARPARARGLGRARRRCPAGDGAGAACLQDRPDRCLGAWPSSVAATSSRRCGCPTPRCVPSASGRASACHLVRHRSRAQEPHPRHPDRLRPSLPGQRPLRCRRPAPARAARAAGRLAGDARDEPFARRRARRRDHRLRARAARAWAPTTPTCRC